MALFPGTYNISVSGNFMDYWADTWTQFRINYYSVAQDLSISSDISLDIPITAYILTGRVTDTNGIGIPDVEVEAPWSGSCTSLVRKTSAEPGSVGMYKLYLLPGTYSLRIKPPSGTRFGATTIEVNISGDTTKDIVLEEQNLLQGTVTLNGVPATPEPGWWIDEQEILGRQASRFIRIPGPGFLR